jgi:transposase
VTRTYAPVGETPILHHTLSRDHLSVIGAVGLHERLYFQVYEQAISSTEVIRFLGHLRRVVPGKLLIVWDGAPIHRSQAIRQFLRDGAAEWIRLERFPGYAPEVDPEEGIWRHLTWGVSSQALIRVLPNIFCSRARDRSGGSPPHGCRATDITA